MAKTCVIGAGNMGSAIISGMIKSGNFSKEDICICDKKVTDEKVNLGCEILDLKDAFEKSDYILIAVKPNIVDSLLSEIKSFSDYRKKVYISIAAGYNIEKAEKILGKVSIIRVMPNICLKALEGMSVICANSKCAQKDIDFAKAIFSSCGKIALTKESLIDACTAINGSGPAYVFMFIEALADGAVKMGIDRETAYILASQTVLGSARLQLESSVHPGKLKDMVCSPGGTTIDAVACLEKSGFRSSVISAVEECCKKAKNLS